MAEIGIAGELVPKTVAGVGMRAQYIVDDNLNKTQEQINQEMQSGLDVFDISAYNLSGDPLAPTRYVNLSAALNGDNVPEDRRKGGMSVKFINSTSGKYEQWRLMSATWSTTVSDWQGVDVVPTPGSNNLVESGGIYNEFNLTDTSIFNDFVVDIVLKDGVTFNVSDYNKLIISDCYELNGTYYNTLRFQNTSVSPIVVRNLISKSYNTRNAAIADFGKLLESDDCYIVLRHVDDGQRTQTGTISLNKDISYNSINEHLIISEYQHSEQINTLQESLSDISDDITDIQDDVTALQSSKQDKNISVSEEVPVSPSETLDNHYLINTGLSEVTGFKVCKFQVNSGDTIYITGSFGLGLSSYLYAWLYSNNTTSSQFKNTSSTAGQVITNHEAIVPEGVVGIYVQTNKSKLATPSLSKLDVTGSLNIGEEVLKIPDMESQIEAMEDEIEELQRQSFPGEINILCLGNSFTQDTMSYVPWLLKEAEPDLNVNLYFVYMGGAPISQYLAYVSGDSVIQENIKYENHGGWDRIYSRDNSESPWITPESGTTNYHKSYTLYKYDNDSEAWDSQSEPTFDNVILLKNWNLITIQQAGLYNYQSWETYFKPYIYKIFAFLKSKVNHNFRYGYLMTHSSYSSSYATLRKRYDGHVEGGTDEPDNIVANTRKIIEETPIDVVFPYATALQNARTTYMDRFGAGGHLMGDTAHVSDGVGCLTCAYANTMAVLDLIGSKKSVVGSQIFPDLSWLNAHNIPAISSTVEGLTPYNIFLCQQCAVMAVKYPLQLTDMVSKGMCGAIEITLDNLNVVSSNPILSANSGESWSTTLAAKSGHTISSISVSMGGTDITSTVVSGNTITINNVTSTVIITVITS